MHVSARWHVHMSRWHVRHVYAQLTNTYQHIQEVQHQQYVQDSWDSKRMWILEREQARTLPQGAADVLHDTRIWALQNIFIFGAMMRRENGQDLFEDGLTLDELDIWWEKNKYNQRYIEESKNLPPELLSWQDLYGFEYQHAPPIIYCEFGEERDDNFICTRKHIATSNERNYFSFMAQFDEDSSATSKVAFDPSECSYFTDGTFTCQTGRTGTWNQISVYQPMNMNLPDPLYDPLATATASTQEQIAQYYSSSEIMAGTPTVRPTQTPIIPSTATPTVPTATPPSPELYDGPQQNWYGPKGFPQPPYNAITNPFPTPYPDVAYGVLYGEHNPYSPRGYTPGEAWINILTRRQFNDGYGSTWSERRDNISVAKLRAQATREGFALKSVDGVSYDDLPPWVYPPSQSEQRLPPVNGLPLGVTPVPDFEQMIDSNSALSNNLPAGEYFNPDPFEIGENYEWDPANPPDRNEDPDAYALWVREYIRDKGPGFNLLQAQQFYDEESEQLWKEELEAADPLSPWWKYGGGKRIRQAGSIIGSTIAEPFRIVKDFFMSEEHITGPIYLKDGESYTDPEHTQLWNPVAGQMTPAPTPTPTGQAPLQTPEATPADTATPGTTGPLDALEQDIASPPDPFVDIPEPTYTPPAPDLGPTPTP